MNPALHPAALLLCCAVAMVAAQFVGYAGLAALLIALSLLCPSALKVAWPYLYRSRWLLLTAWLVLAWGMPGEAVGNRAWLPSVEGAHEASLQVTRILFMLACIAVLNHRLGHAGLLAGLWVLLRPLQGFGWQFERAAVRLGLVLSFLEEGHHWRDWRTMLETAVPNTNGGVDVLRLIVPASRSGDLLWPLAVLGIALFAVSL